MNSERFIDTFVSREHRFSLGQDSDSSGYYLSTPVSGAMLSAEYEAYFTIDAADYARFRATPSAAEAFLEACRMGQNHDRLITPS